MPPETKTAKRGFVALGSLSVVCIFVAGLLNLQSQNRLYNAIDGIADNVRRLAGPANVRESASVDQILAAAATKLNNQDVEIKNLQRSVTKIIKPPNGFYSGDTELAHSEGGFTGDGNTMLFRLVVAGPDGLDFNKTYRYQNLDLQCSKPPVFGQSGSFGVMQTSYPNLECHVVTTHPE